MTSQGETRNPEEAGGLRRELRFWEAIALSIAIMAPTAAMALNGTVPAQLVGRAVPLAFIFATVGVIFVSYAFIRLSGYFSHAGSVYAFSGVTLGPRAGFFSGWALLGTYLAFTAASTAEAGLFGVAFFQGSGIWDGAEWLVIALVAGALIAFFAYGDIRVATRSLLGLEGISVLLIVVLVVIIFVKLLAGSAPQDQGFTADIFKLPSGTSLDTVATAAVFGFLSFAGFEGAASLGEETDNPTRNIPRAILTAVLVAGAFYIVVIIAQTLGFGTDAAGVKAFALLGAARRPVQGLRRQRPLGPHQPRRDGQRVRQRPGHRDGRLADPLRALPRRLRVAPPRRGLAAHGRARRGARGGHDHRHDRRRGAADRRHRPPTPSSTRARSAC